jgi:DNA invertase Pin-like site-specific DNA recombinase
MLELDEIIRNIKGSRSIPSEEDLRSLPFKKAFIYGRVSTQGQVRDSHESIRDVAKLVMLAQKDGYHTQLDQAEIEHWLQSIQSGEDIARVIEDGDIIIDCRDLGLSGSLGEDKRPGLASLRQRVETGEVGAIYLNEGMSRLSRDRDRVLGYKLLKLLKEQRCRIRVLEGVYNPAIPRDWENLADDIEDSADEMKKFGIRLGRRRASKAAEGRHVGSPVCPGYIVEIEGQRSDGSYIMGKWQPYPPHQEVVITALTELVKQRSIHQAVSNLRSQGVVFPFFPQELKYMETRSALRCCHQNDKGYIITTNALKRLATNLKTIGIWEWKNIIIENNHPPIVPLDLFLQAYEIASSNKPRGRAAYTEPMEWSGLLYCCEHNPPRKLSAYNSKKRWACNQDYHLGVGYRCLYIEDHLLTPPLTTEFLRCLDLTPHAQAVLEKLKDEVNDYSLEDSRYRKRETDLKTQITNLERYLGSGDPEREETYWRLIKEANSELKNISQRPAAPKTTAIDLEKVTEFLKNLESNWTGYPGYMRNHLLTLLVDRVELRHDRSQIEATIVWKIGFKQVINIRRSRANYTHEKRWRPEEDNILRMLWSSSSWEAILAALPERTRLSISMRACKLRLSRQGKRKTPENSKPWTEANDKLLKDLYTTGVSIQEIATKLVRTEGAIEARLSALKIKRPKEMCRRKQEATWHADNFKVMHELSSPSGKLPSNCIRLCRSGNTKACPTWLVAI